MGVKKIKKGDYVYYFDKDGSCLPARVIRITKHRVTIFENYNNSHISVKPDKLVLQSEYGG